MITTSNQKPRGILVTGTDTGIGKTVVCSMLVDALDATYFKPVQAGLETPTDSEKVQQLAGAEDDRVIPEAYRLEEPASPHLAAAMQKIEIDLRHLQLPPCERLIIVEGAGGVLVPLNSTSLYVDVFASWQLPTIVCARTTLGTINHTLMTVEVLRDHGIPILGVIFVGDPHPENERIIPHFADISYLGRLPFLEPLNRQTLQAAFQTNFNRTDFELQTVCS